MAEMSKHIHGMIVKAVGGFYYVKSPTAIYECRARGIFRKEEVTPYVGDLVDVEETEQGKGSVVKIYPRKNSLIRPPMANIDNLMIVVSVTDPKPNLLVIDKLTAVAVCKNIRPILVVTKCDIESTTWLEAIYRGAGFAVHPIEAATGRGLEALQPIFEGQLTALTGNTGVGKTTLMNALLPLANLKTGETSKKLGRGKHTTRHVELFEVCGGYVADTPGFSAVDVDSFQTIMKEELEGCFPEFAPYEGACRFQNCAHLAEKGCAVRAALENGKIAPTRYESYRAMYEDAKKLNSWEKNKRGIK